MSQTRKLSIDLPTALVNTLGKDDIEEILWQAYQRERGIQARLKAEFKPKLQEMYPSVPIKSIAIENGYIKVGDGKGMIRYHNPIGIDKYTDWVERFEVKDGYVVGYKERGNGFSLEQCRVWTPMLENHTSWGLGAELNEGVELTDWGVHPMILCYNWSLTRYDCILWPYGKEERRGNTATGGNRLNINDPDYKKFRAWQGKWDPPDLSPKALGLRPFCNPSVF